MRKIIVLLLLIFLPYKLFCQETFLPEDFRQHSLTQYNASLFNPTYSLDWNNPKSLSIWSRWQWQNIDSDPTTLFINYSHSFNDKKAVGVGFLQHNTGTFLNTGGLLNYSQSFAISSSANIIIGANLYLFQQELADDRFVMQSEMNLEDFEEINDFTAQLSPGIRLSINKFNLGISLENAIDYNFRQSRTNDNSIIFNGMISNDFHFELFPFTENSFLRPLFYLRTLPNFENQYGGNLLLSTSKFWLQGGYNSFYGISGGLGVTVFNKLSLGGLIEHGTESRVSNEGSTFELIASYHFGKAKESNLAELIEKEDEEKTLPLEDVTETPKEKKKSKREIKKEAALAQAMREAKEEEALIRKQDSINVVKEKEALLKRQDSINLVKEKELLLRRQDSINDVRAKEAIVLQEKQRLDSIAKVEQAKRVVPLPNEKYEEVARTSMDGLQPGFYLIANVFGTKKYFEAFMKSLRGKGLQPQSFYRSKNKFNYVYLERYGSIEEARKARNSNFNGKYSEKTWIFRVK